MGTNICTVPPHPDCPGHSGDVFFSVLQRGPIIPPPSLPTSTSSRPFPQDTHMPSNFQPSSWHNQITSSVSFLCSPHHHLQIAVSTHCLHFHTSTILLLSLSLALSLLLRLPLLGPQVVLGNKSRKDAPLPPHQCCSRLSILRWKHHPLHSSQAPPPSSGCLSLHFISTCVLTPRLGLLVFLPNTQHLHQAWPWVLSSSLSTFSSLVTTSGLMVLNHFCLPKTPRGPPLSCQPMFICQLPFRISHLGV